MCGFAYGLLKTALSVSNGAPGPTPMEMLAADHLI